MWLHPISDRIRIKQGISNSEIPVSQNHTTPMESQIATPLFLYVVSLNISFHKIVESDLMRLSMLSYPRIIISWIVPFLM